MYEKYAQLPCFDMKKLYTIVHIFVWKKKI